MPPSVGNTCSACCVLLHMAARVSRHDSSLDMKACRQVEKLQPVGLSPLLWLEPAAWGNRGPSD